MLLIVEESTEWKPHLSTAGSFFVFPKIHCNELKPFENPPPMNAVKNNRHIYCVLLIRSDVCLQTFLPRPTSTAPVNCSVSCPAHWLSSNKKPPTSLVKHPPLAVCWRLTGLVQPIYILISLHSLTLYTCSQKRNNRCPEKERTAVWIKK